MSKVEEIIKKKFPDHSVIVNKIDIFVEDKNLTFSEILKLLDDNHIIYTGIQKVVPSLEDIFVEILKETEGYIA